MRNPHASADKADKSHLPCAPRHKPRGFSHSPRCSRPGLAVGSGGRGQQRRAPGGAAGSTCSAASLRQRPSSKGSSGAQIGRRAPARQGKHSQSRGASRWRIRPAASPALPCAGPRLAPRPTAHGPAGAVWDSSNGNGASCHPANENSGSNKGSEGQVTAQGRGQGSAPCPASPAVRGRARARSGGGGQPVGSRVLTASRLCPPAEEPGRVAVIHFAPA